MMFPILYIHYSYDPFLLLLFPCPLYELRYYWFLDDPNYSLCLVSMSLKSRVSRHIYSFSDVDPFNIFLLVSAFLRTLSSIPCFYGIDLSLFLFLIWPEEKNLTSDTAVLVDDVGVSIGLSLPSTRPDTSRHVPTRPTPSEDRQVVRDETSSDVRRVGSSWRIDRNFSHGGLGRATGICCSISFGA